MLEQELARAREARFDALARAVAKPLHRYLLCRADADAADDILAETMLVLWRRLEDVPGLGKGPVTDPDGVLPWCYGVARGCLSNARRADGRRLRLAVADLPHSRLRSSGGTPMPEDLAVTGGGDPGGDDHRLGHDPVVHPGLAAWCAGRSAHPGRHSTLIVSAPSAVRSD